VTRRTETPAQLDLAIDRLLDGGPRPLVEDDGQLVVTARLLRETLPRFHPRFGFEEHVAARLAAARRGSHGRRTPAEVTSIGPRLAAGAADGPAADAGSAAVERRRRSLVAGGAIASGVSLAGAAIVVWRRSRSSGGIL
jgi:hypothetical protein